MARSAREVVGFQSLFQTRLPSKCSGPPWKYSFNFNGMQNFTKSAQSTGPENIGPERTPPDLLAQEAVNSPVRITLENNVKIRPQPDWENAFAGASGGGGGIRTHGGLSPTSVFKTGAFNHSATPPTAAD